MNKVVSAVAGMFHRGRVGVALTAVTIVLIGPGSTAQVVSFDFTGTLSSVQDDATYLPDDIQFGQAFSGTITYSKAHVIDSDASNFNGQYTFSGPAQGDLSISLNLIVPGHVYSFTSVATPPVSPNYIQLQPPNQIDYSVGEPLMDGSPLPAVSNGTQLTVSLKDSSGQAFSSDTLPTVAPLFAAFTSHQLFFEGQANGGTTVYGFEGNLDSITPVPEPATAAACAGAGLLGLGVWRRVRRTK